MTGTPPLSPQSSVLSTEPPPFGRLRWHSRRGILELDILLQRFWDKFGSALSDEDAAVLEKLLEQEDNDLLQLILGDTQYPDGNAARMLGMLRES